jgi:hypothetical protein
MVRGGLATVATAAILGALWGACSSSETDTGTGANGTGAAAQGGSGASNTGGDGIGGWDLGGFGQGGGIEGCDPQSFTLQQAPAPQVYLVIDRSGSMNEPGTTAGQTRWQETVTAVDTAVTQYDAAIEFGLLMYPADEECSTSGPQVLFGAGQRTPILAALTAATPAGGTPTAAALRNASASLDDFGSDESPHFLVLATDGGPNCNYFLDATSGCSCSHAAADACCTNAPATCYFGSSCLDDDGTLAVIEELEAEGLSTFVIGLTGTSAYVELLNEMAVAGGHPQVGATTDYYAASNPAELVAALQTIAVSVISCVIQLTEPPTYPDGVRVYVDGDEVPHEAVNGWEYTDETNMAIELHGTACEDLQDGSEHNVTATFECEVR